MNQSTTSSSLPSSWQIDHIGIAVNSLDTALVRYETLLGTQHYGREKVNSQGVEVAFLDTPTSRIELLAPLDPESIVAKFISKRGEGMHHTAFLVPDIHGELDRLKSLDWELIHPKPIYGAHGKWVAFLHPKSAHGVLIELCAYKT